MFQAPGKTTNYVAQLHTSGLCEKSGAPAEDNVTEEADIEGKYGEVIPTKAAKELGSKEAPSLYVGYYGCEQIDHVYFESFKAAGIKPADGKGNSSIKGSVVTPPAPSKVEEGAREELESPEYDPFTGPFVTPGVESDELAPKRAAPKLVLIPTPTEHERYGAYDETLRKDHLHPHPNELPDTSLDNKLGPDEVVRTNPAEGTEVDEDSEVAVDYNPDNAPEPSPAPGWSPPSIPGVDLSPLEGSSSPCSVIPFGVLCWVPETLSSWTGEGVCPKIGLPIGEGTVGKKGEVGVDTCAWEPAMEVVRPVLVALITLTIGMVYSKWMMGGGSTGDDE